MDCLVRVLLGLDKQVGLLAGFEPDYTGIELSLFYSLYELTLVQSPETDCVSVGFHILGHC